jgi:hypothetical protein
MSGGVVHPSAPGDRRSWGMLDGRPEGIDASNPDRAACRGDAAPVEAAGAVDAQSSAHSSLENHRAGFPQLPQGFNIVMTEEENRKR